MHSPSTFAKICPYCGKDFTHEKRRFCSRSCAVSVSAIARNCPLWEREAVDYLESISGTAPPQILIKRFNARAKRKGWHTRTEKALIIRLKRIGASRKASVDGWTMRELGRILGIHHDRFRLWLKKGLRSQKVSHSLRSISKANLKIFATEHPEYFAGIERDRLLYILEDERIIDQISALKPSTAKHPVKVKRLDTGEVYPSIKAASRACFLHPKTIRDAIKENKLAGGIKFQKAS
jgi:hypothetical protein